MIKKLIASASLLILALALPFSVSAATLEVPSQYSTIQSAIDASVDGDIVNVAAGTYNEVIDLLGKEITVQGAGQGVSILDGTGINDTVLKAISGETLNTIVDGFTIQNGNGAFGGAYGGGAYIESSSITLRDLSFANNGGSNVWGGAVGIWYSSEVTLENVDLLSNSGRSLVDVDTSTNVLFANSSISNNNALNRLFRIRTSGAIFDNMNIENNTSSGNVIYVWGNAPWGSYNYPAEVRNSIIRNNTGSNIISLHYSQFKIIDSSVSENESSGIDIITNTNYSYLDIINSTITRNSYSGFNTDNSVVGIRNHDAVDNNTNILNSIIWGNNTGSHIYTDGVSPIALNYSIIQGGWDDTNSVGILDTDPLFVDFLNGDYSLTSNSPAIDAGDPNSPLDPDGTRADMGAYPFFQVPSPTEQIGDLVDITESFNLQQGINNSLDAKLDAALNALDDLNENNDQAAINSLQAFMNAVEAQRGDKITNDQADILIVAAQEIISNLTS